MVHFEFKVVKRTNCEFPIKEPILKSQFLEIYNKKMENVNKGGWKESMNVELLEKNVFNSMGFLLWFWHNEIHYWFFNGKFY